MIDIKVERVLDFRPGAVIVCGTDGEREIHYASAGIAALTGFTTAEECLRYFGNSHQLLIYAEDEKKTTDSIWRQIEMTGSSFFVTHRVILPDQSIKTIAECGQILRGSEDLFYIFLYDLSLQESYEDDSPPRKEERNRSMLTNIDEETGFFGRKAFLIRAEEAIREILGSRESAAFLHIVVNDKDVFGKCPSINYKTRLIQKIAGMINEAFPDSVAGRLEDDSIVLITREAGAEASIRRINTMLQVYYPNTRISVKAGCYVIDRKESDFRLTDVMRCATSACNSILLYGDICFRKYN